MVTLKDKPLTANTDAIDAISKALALARVAMIVVHGGGSFGHYWSVQYDMHTKPARYDSRGVSLVHESMVALNQIVVNAMIRAGMNPYGIAPLAFMSGAKPNPLKITHLRAMAGSNVTPVTFGDVIHVENTEYSILSGDALMTHLAKALRPSKIIFATNVDGIYKDMDSKELVREVDLAAAQRINFSRAAVADVTGGMQRKITEAFKIASCGMDVLMVNGLRPERIIQAMEGRITMGTIVKGKRRRK